MRKPNASDQTTEFLSAPDDRGSGRVIVVDYSEAARRILAEILREAGYQTRMIASPSELVPAIADWSPDLILLASDDLQMTAADTIRSLVGDGQDEPAIPVIVTGSSYSSRQVSAALNQGACDFLYKPFRKAEVIARARNAVRISEDARSREADRQRLMAERQSRAELMRCFLGHSSDGIFVCNQQGTILAATATALEIFSYPRDQVINANITQLIPTLTSIHVRSVLVPHLAADAAAYIGELDHRGNSVDGREIELSVALGAAATLEPRQVMIFVQSRNPAPVPMVVEKVVAKQIESEPVTQAEDETTVEVIEKIDEQVASEVEEVVVREANVAATREVGEIVVKAAPAVGPNLQDLVSEQVKMPLQLIADLARQASDRGAEDNRRRLVSIIKSCLASFKSLLRRAEQHDVERDTEGEDPARSSSANIRVDSGAPASQAGPHGTSKPARESRSHRQAVIN